MEFIEIKKGNGSKFAPSILGGAFILFFSDSCGHCTSMKPEWDKLKPKLNELQRELNGVNIISVNSDAAGELDSEWHNYASRVPTIIAVDKSGKKHDYNKKRTTKDFVDFMREVLSNSQQKGGKKKRKIHKKSKSNSKKSKSKRSRSKRARSKSKSKRARSKRARSKRSKPKRSKPRSRSKIRGLDIEEQLSNLL